MDNPRDLPNNPDLSSDAKPRTRAITGGEQAHSIARKLEGDQVPRNNLESVIDKKYNGDLPFSRQKLLADNEGWRNNFSTNMMYGIISKVIPAPVGLIDGAEYLTSSELCEDYEDFARKTDIFREKVTKAIRNWPGWKSFQYALWTEVILHGNAIVACLDPYSPWPELYRTDQAFVPVGTGQQASCVPFFSAKKDYLVHEFVEFIKDKQSAEDAGWDTEAAIEAVKNSLPKNNLGSEGSMARTYEDAIREGNPGASYSGADVIQVDHVLAVEPDTKKVTHYIVNRNGKHEVLFQKDDRFESMRDLLALFTIEPGNGHFYGARGMGRILLNGTIAGEANRCLLFDQLRMAGMQILQVAPNSTTSTIQISMRSPIMVVAAEGELAQSTFNINVNSFIEADNQLLKWLEQAAGAYISDLTGDDGGESTATEEQIRARREQQFKIAFLSRAWGQHSDLIWIIQNRLVDPESTDDIAKELQRELKEDGLLPEEIKKLAQTTAAEVIQDMTAEENSKTVAAYQVFANDPAVDQYKLKIRTMSAMVSPQFAKDVLLDPQGLQANEVEAFRQQIGEIEDMIDGASVPVSPRDPHELHLKTGLSEMKRGFPNLPHSPQLMDAYTLVLNHLQAHADMWKQNGGNPAEIKQYEDAVKMFDAALMDLAKMKQKMVREQEGGVQAQGAPPQGQNPQGDPGQPTEAHLIKISETMNYKDVPESIKRQIEAAAGFQPADTATALKEKATTAIESHPDLPMKVSHEQSAALPAPPVQIGPPEGP